jgi:class 3 adenylate cyclase
MDIGGWLRRLGLERYEHAFRENEIDLRVLPELTADDLKELGVTAIGHRRLLLKAIADLAAAAGRAAAEDVPAASPASATTDAERRQLTIMFCDLVGSTALATRLDPEDLREIIGAYHRAVAEVLTRFGGFVAQYMGDGVLAYFGYPQAHEDDAERAVRAGLAVIDTVPALNLSQPLAVRLGIASGLVVVGDLIGEGDAQERGVVGETPNRRFEALRSNATPVVGREKEIALLLRRWTRAKAGNGRVVLITGEPGVGKSRISEALAERIAGEPHIRLRYFCSPHHQDSALYPVIVQMERAAGFARGDAPAEKLAKLKAVLAATASPIEDVALLAELLGLPYANIAPPLDVTPQKRKEKTFEALLRQVERLAQRRPVLMVFEDIQWIDPS